MSKRALRLLAATTALGALGLLACASDPGPPPPSPLRQDAHRAAESGRASFEERRFEASARAYGRAARTYGALDDPEAEAAALRGQGEALRRNGSVEAATEAFERALALDRRRDDPVAHALDWAGLARCARDRGEIENAVAAVERALGLAGIEPSLRAALGSDLALHLLARGRADDRPRILALLAAARDQAVADDDARRAAVAYLNLGHANRRFGDPARAEAELRQALERFRALDDPAGLARTHEELARVERDQDRPDAARSHEEQARRGYEFLGAEADLERLRAGPR
ncbi:MAG: tetratricopeptide repeat protein [Myxococcales bacterium]|nr:tetratricopeptide repeat protein [Myxococcales bacterium]